MLTVMRLNARWASGARFRREIPLQAESPLTRGLKALHDHLQGYCDIRDVDTVRYLTPFVAVVRSARASGPLTGAALSSLHKVRPVMQSRAQHIDLRMCIRMPTASPLTTAKMTTPTPVSLGRRRTHTPRTPVHARVPSLRVSLARRAARARGDRTRRHGHRGLRLRGDRLGGRSVIASERSECDSDTPRVSL